MLRLLLLQYFGHPELRFEYLVGVEETNEVGTFHAVGVGVFNQLLSLLRVQTIQIKLHV